VFSTHVLLAKRLFVEERISCEFTFDDAHISQVELAAPILNAAGLHGVFFVPTAWVGARKETATWRELRALLQAGHRVGSHGNTHSLLTQCTSSELSEELRYSRLTLEDKLGCSITSLSLPGGRCNSKVAAYAASAGYNKIYTSQPSWRTLPPYPSAKEVALIGRLAVRRKMTAKTIEHYLRRNFFTLSKLTAGFQLRRRIRQIIGDQQYQAIWRRILRSPVNQS
jgi:peptidoglycan/xylan/chitin deacetylase (PgdA/CDA1 family)